jgi:hypothetical protein
LVEKEKATLHRNMPSKRRIMTPIIYNDGAEMVVAVVVIPCTKGWIKKQSV